MSHHDHHIHDTPWATPVPSDYIVEYGMFFFDPNCMDSFDVRGILEHTNEKASTPDSYLLEPFKSGEDAQVIRINNFKAFGVMASLR